MKLLAEYNNENKIVGVYSTIKEASKIIGVSQPAISMAMKNDNRCKEHKWKWIEIDNSKLLKIIEN